MAFLLSPNKLPTITAKQRNHFATLCSSRRRSIWQTPLCTASTPSPSPGQNGSDAKAFSSNGVPRNEDDNETAKPKRRRGRPKGSKNKKKAAPWPVFDSSAEPTDWSDASLRAPNGLPESGPADLLQELVPILAAEEMKQFRKPSEDEETVRNLIRETMERLSSNHRASGRLENLRPFNTRPEPIQCDACDGEGMVKCDYCAGEGFVDFGENAKRFHEEFEEGEMTLPKHVMGNLYHCPFCGGLQKERCVKCLGVGSLDNVDAERVPGAAAKPMKDDMWRSFDMEGMMDKVDPDRVEVGLDGLMVVRAKSRKRSGRKPRAGKAPSAEKTEEDRDEDGKAKKPKRGRPRKKPMPQIDFADPSLIDSDQLEDEELVGTQGGKGQGVRVSANRAVGPSTDFLNTTDYQVGRKLANVNILPRREVDHDPEEEN